MCVREKKIFNNKIRLTNMGTLCYTCEAKKNNCFSKVADLITPWSFNTY